MTWDIFCHRYRFYKGNFSYLCVYSPANGNSIQTNPLSLPTPMYWWEREREDSWIFAFHLQHLSRLAPHGLCLTRWIGHALVMVHAWTPDVSLMPTEVMLVETVSWKVSSVFLAACLPTRGQPAPAPCPDPLSGFLQVSTFAFSWEEGWGS